MVSKAVLFTPYRVAAGAMMKVASLWAHNASIALGQLGKTGITIALTEALFRATATMYAVNIANTFDGYVLANRLV